MNAQDPIRGPRPDAVSPAASEGSDAALPGPIRLHLGRLLAAAYTRSDEAPHVVERFAGLLARLEAALAGARDRDEATFQSELLTHVPALGRFAVSLTRDPSAADDLVQDALLRAWRSRAGFAPGTNMEAWLFTILRNQFYSDRRKLGREVQDEDGARASRLAAVPEQAGHLDLADVRAALARLPPEMREALLLIAVSGVTYERAAAILGCQLGTVKSRVNRGRHRLVKALGYADVELGQDPLTLSAMSASP